VEISQKIDNNKAKLGYRERDILYQKEYASLRIKIALNCFELFALFTVVTVLAFLALSLTKLTDRVLLVISSVIISFIITLIFYKIKKYQISIDRFDKEAIYKKISKDLLKTKS
jgi:hypothetical protein